ncbi:hypothetical protein M3Y99_01564800 [Aphelenchoides fujianensis]|nr:hypothetical protein M3Y99_01833900 [Aphelenchoides fujianensis]KAI6221282.1 hypothetical protein M3Y99_01564800 [Aphelenchoides fujianensis]
MVCGPKLSATCAVLSVWGIIFMAILGLLFQNRSVGLFEDLPKPERFTKEIIEKAYSDAALKCYIACGIYGGLFVVSAIRFWTAIR